LVFHAYINEMLGSRSKIPSNKSRPCIYDVKFLALLGAPCIYDISKLRVKGESGSMVHGPVGPQRTAATSQYDAAQLQNKNFH
jgi:hypothetical protein